MIARLAACALVVLVACNKPPAAPAPTEDKKPAAVSNAASPRLCEHKVPAELCTQCNPELVEVFKEKGDWCNQHGVPESHCYQCNPKLTFSAGVDSKPSGEPWCNEHGVPEAKCTKCKPQLISKFIEAGDFCREHGLPESVCPYCHPERAAATGHGPPVFPPPGTRVRLASPETEREAGIQTVKVASRKFTDTVNVVGELDFNQNRLARLSARGAALVVEVKVDVGDEVKRGQPLVVLASGSVGQDQSRLTAAKARVDAATAALSREQTLLADGITSKQSVDNARTELAAAQAEYEGARASLRAAGAAESGSAGQYTLTAPFDGTVVAREAVAGKSVAAETMLVEVADLSSMWALLDVPAEVAPRVRVGQRATIELDGAEPLTSSVSRMSVSVDPRTRTAEARVELPNLERRLLAGVFVRARIEVTAEHEALLVPEEAVQRAQGASLVFVRSGPGEYVPATVKIGGRAGKEVEILSGLTAGANVVTTGAFLLKTEILKDSIGAGCTDD